MRSLIITIILILVTAGSFAADKETDKGPRETPEASTIKKSTSQERVKKKTPEWPRPYKSTEEISVDSTVPFPTDI
jgi:hypothetical protein